ncbi:MAG: DUF692 family protein, partial [Chloroflexi bacterium]|nr:DUF692 family protein [Chloroflexota bacterium]
MPKLTANYSSALEELIRSDDAPIDGIEVGPWYSPKEIRLLQRELPAWEFQYHASNFLSRLQYRPGAIKLFREYHTNTKSQWVSVHIELLPLHVYYLSSRYGIHLNPPEVEKIKSKIIDLLARVKQAAEVPVILENLASLPEKKYAYAANPDIITEIVETTDSGFLLDIAHARLAAIYQGVVISSYLEKLPLERIEQIHVSGIRMQNGHLRDSHESLESEDYALLK